MFNKSKRKIVAAIMGILTVLWAGTLGMIYGFSYFEISATNLELLKEHSMQYRRSNPSEEGEPNRPVPDKDRRGESEAYQRTTFYSVAFTYNEALVEVENTDAQIYSDDELVELARQVLVKPDYVGVTDNLAYYRADKGGYTLVSFMDHTAFSGSMNTMFRYTLIFGGAALVAMYFLARYLAKRIVTPLEESYQKQRQFISDAGHELKTPISVVNANSELLSREVGDNQWLQNIQYENERMGKLVGQLLELARTENVSAKMERLDLSRLVDGEALPFDGVAFEQGLILNETIDAGLSVNGNSAQLKQLVSILLDNAIRHGKEGKEVCLTLEKEHGQAKLTVVNTGKAIPVEHRKNLFERFYRVDSARNGEDKHYGLGLAIAKAIVENHKGRIDVQCYDGFVEFRVFLPLA